MYLEDEVDYRGLPVYRIVFDVETPSGAVVTGLVHRAYIEFQKLDQLLTGE